MAQKIKLYLIWLYTYQAVLITTQGIDTGQFLGTKNTAALDGTLLVPRTSTRGLIHCVALCIGSDFCQNVMYKEVTRECSLLVEYMNELTLVGETGTAIYSKPRSCNHLELYDKQSWNPYSHGNPGALSTPVSFVVIHHTALSRGNSWPSDCGTLADCLQAVRDIQYYDMNIRSSSWADIGINFMLDGSGRFYEGRGWDRVAAYLSIESRGGVQGYGMHVGITLFGDFRFQEPTLASKLALRLFCSCAIEQGFLTKSYTVLGHVEDKPFTSYECPGQSLLDMLHRWPNLT